MAEAVSNRFDEFVNQSANAPWKLWVDPFRVAPNIYYVGNEWVGIFLVDYKEGLILIDSGVYENVYLTLEAVRKLGFDPYKINHIMLTHCHSDHAFGAPALSALTGAAIWLSREDAAFRDSHANEAMNLGFRSIPYEVNRFYGSPAAMEFGPVTIRTFLTPGHTPGTTSFFITSTGEDGRPLTAAIHGGVGPMTMKTSFLDKYGLPRELRRTFIDTAQRLKQFHVDITLPSHPSHGNRFWEKRGKNHMDYSNFVAPEEWSAFLDLRAKFIQELD